MIDTVIKNCKVVSPADTRDVGIGIDKGVIVAIDSDDKLPQARETIDAKGKHVGITQPVSDKIKGFFFNRHVSVCGNNDTSGKTFRSR